MERPLLRGDSDSDQDDGDTRAPESSKRALPSTGLLSSSFDRSFANSYGTISSRVSESTRRHAIQFHREHHPQVHVDGSGDSDRGPLLIKHVQHEDGTEEDIVVGQSTLPQTIFNSVNVLIGIGLLSLPLAMKHAGWVLGLVFLIFSAVATSYTAKILAKCLDVDRSVVTYADLAYISFGQHARLITSFLFCLELLVRSMRCAGCALCRQFICPCTRIEHPPMEDRLWSCTTSAQLPAATIPEYHQHIGHNFVHIK